MIWLIHMLRRIFGCYDSWVASWVVRFVVIGHIVKGHLRCGQHVSLVLLRIMGLHREYSLRWMFALRGVGSHPSLILGDGCTCICAFYALLVVAFRQ